MDFKQVINSDEDIQNLTSAYLLALYGNQEEKDKALKDYPGITHMVEVTRRFDGETGRQWIQAGVLAIEENGRMSLQNDPRPGLTDARVDQAEPQKAKLGGVSMDFGRVINSKQDIFDLVHAYRRVLHGDENVEREVYRQFPELEPLVKQTRLYYLEEAGSPDENWEAVGVEAIFERGRRVLEEKSHSQKSPLEVSGKAALDGLPTAQLLAYVGSDGSQLDPAQQVEVIKTILGNASRQAGIDDTHAPELA